MSIESSVNSILSFLAKAHAENMKIVLVTGVFDLFHSEHQAFLHAASEQGDVLIVGIESDVRVKQIKGPGRPKQSQDIRLQQVITHPTVTEAFILPVDFSTPEQHRELIALIHPAVLAVSEHSPHQEKKQAILEEFGGEVRVVRSHNTVVSTTLLLQTQK